ncbi:MAG: ABC transporter substrate-binding protein [Candidatus Latescibacterota bacterium]|nr:ABC transporter substrate-binding protein [Candidatus Latescibacterota bacterium]
MERADLRTESVQEPGAPLEISPDILLKRSFGEAPSIRAKVDAGQLPVVSDRLPENPLVVVPVDVIGRYGGTIRRALTGDIVQTAGVNKTLADNLMGYERPMPNSIQHNLAEKHWFEDEGRVAFFKLRDGIKWSDGHPLTVDDVLFWYNDMNVDDNARASAALASVWVVDGEPIRMEKVDDLTLKVVSPKPLGRVLQAFCATVGVYPKHKLKHLHPRYNPNANYETFRDSTTAALLTMNPGLPRITAWVPVRWERGQRILYERNPYYWKVDTAGNQLPYADHIEFNVIQDSQVILLKFMNGEIDLFGRYSQVSMFPILKAGERNGKFKIRVTGPERGTTLYLNWDSPNPRLKDAFRTLEVRQALSHAINREEIKEIIFHGLLDVSGYSFAPQSPYFSKEAYTKYTTYDPDLANQLLDQVGLVDRDRDGVRDLADGSPFAVNIDCLITPSFNVDLVQLVAEHWAQVGIKVYINAVLRNILWPRRGNGEFDIHVWSLEGPADPLARLNDWAIMNPTVPFWHKDASTSAQPWLFEATKLIKNAISTIDTVKLREQMTRVRDLHTDNVAAITIGSRYHVWGAGTRLGNVPMQNTAATAFQGWSRPIFHEQIFIRE